MLRFVLLLTLFCALSCSKEQPPTAPAGKKNCALCDFLGDPKYTPGESDGDTASDSTSSSSPDSTSSASPDSSSSASPDDTSPSSSPVSSSSDGVFIPDAALRTYIEQVLKKSPGETIMQGDMNTLKYQLRDGFGLGIKNLRGLETAKELRLLYLDSNQISDLTPLANLDLLYLSLSGNQISDLTPLANLDNLRHITLNSNNVSNLSLLTTLPSLKRLHVRNNPLSEASINEHIPALESRGVEVEFSVSYSSSSSNDEVFIPDAALRRYIEEELKKSLGETIRQGDMNTLRHLYYETIRQGDMYQLRHLYYGSSLGIKNLRGLEAAKNLEILRISSNKISDLTPLANLLKLIQLYINFTEVSDLTPLANLTRLEDLYISSTEISDLTPLANLTRLEDLRASNNKISDLTPLANLTRLENLNISFNEVSDLTPLANLPSLRVINLDGNNVSDLSPLTTLPRLFSLDARGNPLSEASINEHIPALQRRGIGVSFSSFHLFTDTEDTFTIDLVFLDDVPEWEQEMWHNMVKRWESAIPIGLPDYEFSNVWFGECGGHSIEIPAGEQIDDLRIYITKFSGSHPDEQEGTVYAGYGAPRLLRSSSLPIIGCIGVKEPYAFLPFVIALHEIGHVLGIGTIWDDSGMLRDLGADTHFAGPQAIAAFDQPCGGARYGGAKVPTEPDGAHWRDSVLSLELMSPFIDNQRISEVTLGALSDLGYSVDLSAADPYTVGASITISTHSIAGKPVADATPFCSLEGQPAPVYVDD